MRYVEVETYRGYLIVKTVNGRYARVCVRCNGFGYYDIDDGLYSVCSCAVCKGDAVVGGWYTDIGKLRSRLDSMKSRG